MSGRPKGTTKSGSKKLQTYRLSEFEKFEVEKLLKQLRNKRSISLPNVKNFNFTTNRLNAKYICVAQTPEQIKELYVVIDNDSEKFLIVKCPIIETTSKSYVMTIYKRNFPRTGTTFSKGLLVTLKINKTNLQHRGLEDSDLIHYHNQAYRNLDEALGYLYTKLLKPIIIYELLKSNDLALMLEYLKITSERNNNEAMGLEYVYNVLGLDLFSIEDDTKNSPGAPRENEDYV